MTNANQVTHGLPRLTFRGIEAPPYNTAGFNFSHDQAEKKFPFVNGAAHEHVGLNPLELPVTMFFHNNLGAGLFPELWDEWRDALFDGSPGEIVHPLAGTRLVVVRGGNVALTARITAGVTVQVTFSTTILDPAKAQEEAPTSVNVIGELGAAADEQLEAFDIPFPDGYVATSFTAMMNQITSFSMLIDLEIIGVIGRAQQVITVLLGLIDTLDRTHAHHVVIDALVELWGGLQDLSASIVATARATGGVVLNFETTLDQFARDHGNELEDIIGLNPSALLTPSVPKGTMLRFYT